MHYQFISISALRYRFKKSNSISEINILQIGKEDALLTSKESQTWSKKIVLL